MTKPFRISLKTLAVSPFILALGFLSMSGLPAEKAAIRPSIVNVPEAVTLSGYSTLLYDSLGLEDLQLSRQAFLYAMQGYQKMQAEGSLKNPGIISVVDFTLPSDKKRLFVIDLVNIKILYNTYTAHGRNSGEAIASSFSNRPESFKSSLGFYVTGDCYRGEHGYSLRLIGKEKGINDNAYSRKIVVHSADYVSEKTISQKGYLGRSLGCPALPQSLNKAIINTIKNGTCLFMYGQDPKYLFSSRFVLPQPNFGTADSLPFLSNKNA